MLAGTVTWQAAAQEPKFPPLKGRTAPPAPPQTILPVDSQPIDLDSALKLAGIQNPAIRIARERLTEAAAVRLLAAAQALPNLNAGTNYNLHRGPLQQANGNILKVNRDAMYVGLGAGAVGAGSVSIPGVNYNLNIGTAWFGYLQAQQVRAFATANVRTTENDTFLAVCAAYSELLRSNARLSIAAENREEAAELARLTLVYADGGQGRRADANRAEVELRKRDAEQTQYQADVLTRSAQLVRLLNIDSTARLIPIDGWAVPAPVVPDPIPLGELVAIALLQRPELEERRAEIAGSLYALSSAKVLPFSPTVILGFSAGGFGGGSDLISQPQGFVGGDGQRVRESRFGNLDGRQDLDAAVYWTFRNLGVGNVALMRGAESRVRQANYRQQETVNRVRTEVAESDARVRSKLSQIDTLAKALDTAREGYKEDLARIRNRGGLPIEVIDSLKLLARARYDYLDAIVDYNIAQFRLYVSLGQPPMNMLARPIPVGLVGPVKP